ncbi:MAG: ABC transporter substrate-binding protein [Dehalococcoidia bacterium]
MDNYWTRARTGRITRRRVLAGAGAAGIGTAALGLVGCGDDDDPPSPTTAPAGTTAASPSAAASATAAGTPVVAKQRGGTAHFTSAGNTWDTFDSDRSRFGPMGTVFGLAYQGIVSWESFKDAKIGGYFAQSYEQIDKQTITFRVRDNLFWHDKKPLNGRQATAADMKFHIERNKAGKLKDGTADANFYRQPLFQVVDKVELVDAKTIKVTFTKPWPFFLNTLAATWTKVTAPEAVDAFESDFAKFNVDQLIGTGNFVVTDFKAEGSVSFKRHPKAVVNPWWDGVEYRNLFTDAAAQQAAFEQKQIDAFGGNVRQAVLDELEGRFKGQVVKIKNFIPNPVTGTFFGGAPPWQDERMIGGIYQALDRRDMIQQIYQGNGLLCAFVPPAWAPFALPEKDLITFPGYLEDRKKDEADAKAKWLAAGGDKIGEVTVDIPDIFEGSYAGIGAAITNKLKSVLGNDFKPAVQPYSTITAKLVGQQYGNGNNNVWFGWGNPPGDPDPSIDYINAFKSTSSQYKQWNVALPKMDGIAEKLENEFDVKNRITLNHDGARELLAHNGGGILPSVEGISNTMYWNYFRLGEITFQVTSQNVARDLWFDQKDPTWQGRPA